MTFQSAPECAEAVLHGTYFGKPIANVFNCWYPGGYNQTKIDALAAVFDTWWDTDYAGLCANTVNYVETTVKGLENIIDLTATNSSNAGTGTHGAVGNSPNVTQCMTHRTGFTGRSARGRTYLWPTDTSSMTDPATFIGTYISACDTAFGNLLTVVAASGWQLVVLSRQNNKAPRLFAIHTTVTTITARNNLVDSMRNRLSVGH